MCLASSLPKLAAICLYLCFLWFLSTSTPNHDYAQHSVSLKIPTLYCCTNVVEIIYSAHPRYSTTLGKK